MANISIVELLLNLNLSLVHILHGKVDEVLVVYLEESHRIYRVKHPILIVAVFQGSCWQSA